MKYIRILIVVLVFVLIGIGAYYVYLKVKVPKSNKTSGISNTETATSFIFEQKTGGDLKYKEYTSTDLRRSSEIVTISGRFQAVDTIKKEVDGVSYDYVLGILGNDGFFSRILLTSSEYQEIGKIFSDGSMLMLRPVILTMSRDKITLERIEPSP
jgi:hypothetical protein